MTALRTIKRIIVAVAGGTVLALGIALIVLPGPAFLAIPAPTRPKPDAGQN
jgi:hypothetical protein